MEQEDDTQATLNVFDVDTVPVQTSDPQTSDGTNIRLTNVGQYKRRTSTNVGPVQASDQYKRQTGTNVGRVHL